MMKHGNLTALVYAACLPGLQQIAAQHGYAIAVHGSMQRDFDLVAIPWVDDVSEPLDLVNAIASELGHFGDEVPHGPEKKPHGRLAWTISLGAGLRLDLSVVVG